VSEERQRVLRMLKEGKVTVEEAEALLEALGEADLKEPADVAARPSRPAGEPFAEPSAPAAPPGPEAGRSDDEPQEPHSEFHRMMDDIMKAVDVDGIMESVRASLRRSGVEMGRVKDEVRRARDRVREETRRAAREYRRYGWGRISRTIEGLWGLTPAAGVWSHDADLAPGRRLILHNLWGDIRLKPSDDGRLRAAAVTRAWGRDEADAAALRDAIRIVVTDDGSAGMLIKVEPPAGDLPRRFRVDFTLQVPSGVGVDILQSRGDVEVAGLGGDLTVRLASGDLAARDVQGTLRFEGARGDVTASRVAGGVQIKSTRADAVLSAVDADVSVHVLHGDIGISDVKGDLDVQTMHGDIRVAGVAGRITARSKHGDLMIATAPGPAQVDAETARGDVRMDVARFEPGTTSHVSTMSGDISIHLGEQAHCRVAARVTAGEINVRAPLLEMQQGRRVVQGVYGSPAASLEASTVSGEVTIEGSQAGVSAETTPAGTV
jgi:DUF4097 and DUF4098 domain-containing protein YvlB